MFKRTTTRHAYVADEDEDKNYAASDFFDLSGT